VLNRHCSSISAQLAVGDELVYASEVTSEIIDFEVEDTDQGRAYWLSSSER